MNHNFMLFSPWPFGLFATAILCALLSFLFPRQKIVFLMITALFSEIGMIIAFVMGATLQEMLIPFLVLLWISLCSHKRVEGEKE